MYLGWVIMSIRKRSLEIGKRLLGIGKGLFVRVFVCFTISFVSFFIFITLP